jgi:hypothetical protein
MKIEKQLREINSELRSISKRIEKSLEAFDNFENSQSVEFKIGKFPTKRRINQVKSISKNISTENIVFGLIQGSKKGITINTLVEKTGCTKKEIKKSLYHLKKQKKIHNYLKGVYTSS